MHPYTQNLKESIPHADPDHIWSSQVDLAILDTDEYSRQGCRYAGRCAHIMDVCRTNSPGNLETEERTVKCFLYDPAVAKSPATVTPNTERI